MSKRFKSILRFIGSALVISCCFLNCSNDPQSPSFEDYSSSFDKIWNDFDLQYSYFIYKGIDWDRLKTKYEPLVNDQITYSSFIEDVVGEMLRELKDLHVSLVDRDGNYIPLYSRQIDVNYNYDNNFFNHYFSGNVDFTSNRMFGFAAINDSIGYLLISTWNRQYQTDVSQFHQQLERFRNYKALIIDVRPNNGGSELLAIDVAGRFTDKTRIYAYHQFRNGPEHDDFTQMLSRSFSPTGGWQFMKPIALLIGERCMSSSEAFILMLSRLDHVVTIGDTTRGSSGNPKEFKLNDGTKYSISSWVAYKSDQTVLEDVGIFPDIAIPPDSSIVNGKDLVLEKAIAVLSSSE